MSAAANTLQCDTTFDNFYDKIIESETWSGDANKALKSLEEAILPALRQVSSGTSSDILKTQHKYLELIDSKSEGSAEATEAIKTVTRDGVFNINEIFNNISANIAQTYYVQVIEFSLHGTHTPEDIRNLNLLPLHVIKTDFIRSCEDGLRNVENATRNIKNNIHRIHGTFNVMPKHIPNVPKGYELFLRPYILNDLNNVFLELQSKKEEGTFPQAIIAKCTFFFTQISEKAPKQLDANFQSLVSFLNDAEFATADKGKHLIEKAQKKVNESKLDITDLLEKAQADIKTMLPPTYDEHVMRHWIMSARGQDKVNVFCDKINDILSEASEDIVNLYELEIEID